MTSLQQIIEEEKEIMNNSIFAGSLEGRTTILIGGENDREWDGGGYEENQYQYLDTEITQFAHRIIEAAFEAAAVENAPEIKHNCDDPKLANCHICDENDGWDAALEARREKEKAVLESLK